MLMEKTKLTMYLVLLSGSILCVWGLIELGLMNFVVSAYFQPGTPYYGMTLMGMGLLGLTSLLTGVFLLFLSAELGRASMIARKCGIITGAILFVLSAWVLFTGPLNVLLVLVDPAVKTICGLLVLVPLILYRYYFNW